MVLHMVPHMVLHMVLTALVHQTGLTAFNQVIQEGTLRGKEVARERETKAGTGKAEGEEDAEDGVTTEEVEEEEIVEGDDKMLTF
jgi:hypothetical protein